ncbi:HGE-14 family type IV secretion system effector [Anaplasma phagocytophilum]|uniref:HGE-14 family type IV secretion system effector n=1 Tax=Anaplasma phagocytophilum TaxID=948 RepID=UPI00200DA128|nr:hypothetical protein [Anaplasma phagocytophilum]UQD53990.1 hypothetical protein ESP60_00595 [Anaplasma phagocytophilum]
MHTPRIFTSPGMSGYVYSGSSSKEYRDNICAAITSGTMLYAECMEVVRGCVSELFSVFTEIRESYRLSEEHVRRIELLRNYVNAESTLSAEPTVQGRVLYGIITRLYDVLYDCTVAECNKEVAWFMDPGFTRRGVHLQIAQACGILVNSIAIASCFAKTVAAQSLGAMNESDAENRFHAGIALSAYTNIKFSALSRCLNASLRSEGREYRRAVLLVVQHNMELCNKVAELLDSEMPSCFRNRTGSCLNKVINAVESSSTACEDMVCNDESAQWRLSIAKKAMACLLYHLKTYRGLRISSVYRRFERARYTGTYIYAIGSLFLVYRGYASTGNAEHVVAVRTDHCLQMLLNLHKDNIRRERDSASRTREVYLGICSIHEDIDRRITPDLLLNPRVEVELRSAALQYLSSMMVSWRTADEAPLDVVEQPDGSPDQPSTSGSGSAGVGGSQASYTLPHDPGHMPDSDVQPSTSAEASSALQETQVASHGSRTPSNDDLEPPIKRSRSA